MPLTDSDKEGLTGMDDHALIETWDSFKAAEDSNKEGRQYVEYLLLRRMTEREANAVASGTHDIKLTPAYDTDINALEALKELVDPAMIDTAYTAPQQVWTEPKWNMVVVNSWRKFGEEIRAVIDGAKMVKPARISIKRKAVKP